MVDVVFVGVFVKILAFCLLCHTDICLVLQRILFVHLFDMFCMVEMFDQFQSFVPVVFLKVFGGGVIAEDVDEDGLEGGQYCGHGQDDPPADVDVELLQYELDYYYQDDSDSFAETEKQAEHAPKLFWGDLFQIDRGY